MELTRIRIGTDITMSVSLSDSGIKLSWDGVEVKHVVLYSDAQRIQAGRGEYLIDPSDPELMQVKYKAGQQCYLGAYRLVVQFVLQAGDSESRTYTADVPCFELVATTEEVGNVPSSGDDDVIGLHLDLESIDSSLVQEIIDACINAAETANKAAEAANETDRIATNNEAERVESESKRKYNESVRITNEKARQDAEALRLTGEKERAQAETGRVNAESSRVSAEDSRATAEDGRAEAEKGRAESESLRMAAENKRVEAETGRSEAETKRTAAESERAEAELLRARSESDRSSAETLRQEAESVRSQAEAGRVAAENGRVSAEEIRVGAEQERETAEALRQEAETKRQEDTSAAITAANEAAAAANDAASNVDTEQLVPRIRNLEEQMPNKQETLVSGENIKTVNGENVLGPGDIRIDLSLYKVVESLPETDIDPNKIYLVINTSGTDGNEYTEYGYIDGKWEELGTYRATVDLTPYMKKEDADRTYATKTELSGKQPLLTPGKDIGISSENVISYTGSKQLYIEAESLPESPEEEYKDRIYLVPAEYPTESSVYDKYIWVADAGGIGHWEQFTGGGNGAVLVLDDLFNNSLTYAGEWNEEFEQKIGATLEQIEDIIRRDGQIIVRHKLPIPPDAEGEGVVIQDNSSLIPCMASIIGMSMTEGETSGTIEYIMITGIESGLGDMLSSSDNWSPAIYSVYFQSQEVNGEFSGAIIPLAMGSKYLTNDSIVNSLYSDEEDKALAARQGKVLDGKITVKQDKTDQTLVTEDKTVVGAINTIAAAVTEISEKVSTPHYSGVRNIVKGGDTEWNLTEFEYVMYDGDLYYYKVMEFTLHRPLVPGDEYTLVYKSDTFLELYDSTGQTRQPGRRFYYNGDRSRKINMFTYTPSDGAQDDTLTLLVAKLSQSPPDEVNVSWLCLYEGDVYPPLDFVPAVGDVQKVIAQAFAELYAAAASLAGTVDNAGHLKVETLDMADLPLVCGERMHITGEGAPSVPPAVPFQEYYDISNNKFYRAKGVLPDTPTTGDWVALN